MIMKHTISVTMATYLDPRMLPCMFENGEKPHTCSLPNEGGHPHGKLGYDGIQCPGHDVSVNNGRTEGERRADQRVPPK